MNKFEWDLKYPAATNFKGMILWSAPVYAGPTAVPGNYKVAITAGGKTVAENLSNKQIKELIKNWKADHNRA